MTTCTPAFRIEERWITWCQGWSFGFTNGLGWNLRRMRLNGAGMCGMNGLQVGCNRSSDICQNWILRFSWGDLISTGFPHAGKQASCSLQCYLDIRNRRTNLVKICWKSKKKWQTWISWIYPPPMMQSSHIITTRMTWTMFMRPGIPT